MSTTSVPSTTPANEPAKPGSGEIAKGPVSYFGREPALWLALVAALVQLAALLLGLSDDQQALINAFAVAISGGITAYIVREGQVPALLGLIKAGIALAIGFGLHLQPQNQAVIMAILTALSALAVRTQVVAPIARSGHRVTPEDISTGRV